MQRTRSARFIAPIASFDKYRSDRESHQRAAEPPPMIGEELPSDSLLGQGQSIRELGEVADD
jgi:hypothetical protein